MNKQLTAGLVGAAMSAALAGAAFADDVRVRSVRITAPDIEAAADFYEAAFGMHEVRRIGTFEIVLNFGATPEEAAEATGAAVVIMRRAEDAPAPPDANLLLGVPDMDAALAAVAAHGGEVQGEARTNSSGITYAFFLDPQGNRVELIAE